MERVIFREEQDTNGKGYIAIFPDDLANSGKYGAVAFTLDNDKAIFEPYMEINALYMYEQKIIHKKDNRIPKLLQAIENYYNIKFKVVEKITR